MTKGHSSHYIMGNHALEEVLNVCPQRVQKIWAIGALIEKAHKQADHYLTLAHKQGIPIQKIEKNALTQMVQTESHQGVVAQLTKKQNLNLDEALDSWALQDVTTVVLLDSIYDPQNLGAILRACECFGVDAVIWSKNRGTDITSVVTKASAGASELIPTIIVSNLVQTVQKLLDEDFCVIAAQNTSNAIDLDAFTFPKKRVIMMGSEGKGIQPLLQKQATHLIKIPMKGHISSLNVSQATAVMLAFASKRSS